VQCAEVFAEQSGEIAYGPSRQLDPVLAQQGIPDLLALAVVEIAFGADEDHHVIAYGSTGQKGLSQGISATRDQGATGLPAPGRARMNGFASAEDAVLERAAPVWDGLLHLHRPAAKRAGARLLAHDHLHSRNTMQLARAAVLQALRTCSQLRERL
jgi:hypothetical protein